MSIKLSGQSKPGRGPISAKAGSCLAEEAQGGQGGGWSRGSKGEDQVPWGLMLQYRVWIFFFFFGTRRDAPGKF